MGAGGEQLTDYRQLFVDGVPLLDTRAPVEFAQGAFPTAENLPLLSDAERAQVGTCYKQQGPAAAISLGHQLVSGDVKARRLDAWRDFARRHPEGCLYCFRGGMRSEIVQSWLYEAGIEYPRVSGGYKALRRFLLETLEERARSAHIQLVAGATGSGKTRVIHRLPRAVDLEGLACHRGSTFGSMLEEQPTQIDFENRLAIQLLKLADSPESPVFLEDEGRLIGRLALPGALRRRMQTAPMYIVEEPLERRVDVLLEDYIVDLGRRYQQLFGQEAASRHQARLQDDLCRIRKRLGFERRQRASELMHRAFDEQQATGSVDGHRAWIALLLREYYDPMYDYQMAQREGRRLFAGSREAVIEAASRAVHA